MNRIILVLLLCLQWTFAFSQGVTLSGKIIDDKTKAPVPFASIFLAATLLGTSADAAGVYRITGIPHGKYDLTISSVGYKVRQVSVSFANEPVEFNIELTEETKLLKEVVVKAKKLDYKKLAAEFKIYFIGLTPNARECTITNLDKIDFDFDEDTDVFTASCGEPIQVENRALGYRIYYLLQVFSIDHKKNRCTMGGIPRFEELIPRNEKEMHRWQKARDRAYYGSINHFMRSLKMHCLAEDKFEIYKICEFNRVQLDPDALFADDTHSTIVSECPLQIVYKGRTQYQFSKLKLFDGVLTIYDNGYYEDQLRLELQGHYALTEKIAAEILPLEFEPLSKISK